MPRYVFTEKTQTKNYISYLSQHINHEKYTIYLLHNFEHRRNTLSRLCENDVKPCRERAKNSIFAQNAALHITQTAKKISAPFRASLKQTNLIHVGKRSFSTRSLIFFLDFLPTQAYN